MQSRPWEPARTLSKQDSVPRNDLSSKTHEDQGLRLDAKKEMPRCHPRDRPRGWGPCPGLLTAYAAKGRPPMPVCHMRVGWVVSEVCSNAGVSLSQSGNTTHVVCSSQCSVDVRLSSECVPYSSLLRVVVAYEGDGVAICFTVCTSAVGRPSCCTVGSAKVVGGPTLFPAGNRSQVIYPISLHMLMRLQRPTNCVASMPRQSTLGSIYSQWRLISQSPVIIPQWAPEQKMDMGERETTSISAPGPSLPDRGNPPPGRNMPSTPGQPRIPHTKSRGWAARQISETSKSRRNPTVGIPTASSVIVSDRPRRCLTQPFPDHSNPDKCLPPHPKASWATAHDRAASLRLGAALLRRAGTKSNRDPWERPPTDRNRKQA